MRYKAKFQQYLDETAQIKDGYLQVGSFSYPPSEVLEAIDEISFNEQYDEWYQNELDIILGIAASSYPYPIARYAAVVLDEYDNCNHRLQALRSLWECIINFMFALIIGECTHLDLNLSSSELSGKPLKFSDCYTEKIALKIAISKVLITTDFDKEPLFKNLFTPELCDDLSELNKQRNKIQHALAQDEDMSKSLFDSLIDDVNRVLYDLNELENIRCMIYKSSQSSPTEIIFGVLSGDSGIPKNKDGTIIDGEVLQKLKKGHVFIENNGLLFNISPFFIYLNKKIAYHKKSKNIYSDIADSSKEYNLDFSPEWDLIKKIF